MPRKPPALPVVGNEAVPDLVGTSQKTAAGRAIEPVQPVVPVDRGIVVGGRNKDAVVIVAAVSGAHQIMDGIAPEAAVGVLAGLARLRLG
jgi:hypothetical protein